MPTSFLLTRHRQFFNKHKLTAHLVLAPVISVRWPIYIINNVVIDAGVHLEADGPLVFSCYERLSAVAHAVAVDHYPNTEAVSREIANCDAAKASVRPGLKFYQKKIIVQFCDTVKAYIAVRFCCPVQVQKLRPTAATLEGFRNFPFSNNDATIANNHAREILQYIATAEGATVTCEDDDKVRLWVAHRDTLPFWAAIVKKLLLLQPSSATAEPLTPSSTRLKI